MFLPQQKDTLILKNFKINHFGVLSGCLAICLMSKLRDWKFFARVTAVHTKCAYLGYICLYIGINDFDHLCKDRDSRIMIDM